MTDTTPGKPPKNTEDLSTSSSAPDVTSEGTGRPSPERDDREADGIRALLSLAGTLLQTSKSDDPNSLIVSIAQATGVLAYLQNEVIGVERDHPLFKKSLLEGSEMATVFAVNFDLSVPGIVWVSLHEDSPEVGGEALLEDREKALIVDITGNGERVNITTIRFEIPEDVSADLNFLGMWTEAEGGELIEAGQLAYPLSLKDRTSLSLSPGGLRVKKNG